jgi:palmitoyltransferase
MDHHCIWTQTCIGYSNQKCFYLFCIYMTIGVLQFWYFTVRVLKERQLPIFDMMEPGVVILWVFTGLSAFFVGLMIVALAITHTLMVLTNFRTLDGMKTGKMCPLPFLSTQNDP